MAEGADLASGRPSRKIPAARPARAVAHHERLEARPSAAAATRHAKLLDGRPAAAAQAKVADQKTGGVKMSTIESITDNPAYQSIRWGPLPA